MDVIYRFLGSIMLENGEVQEKIERELERLKAKTRMGYELKVVWLPGYSSSLSGEVKGETIYIYEEELEEALETLKHEFLDYIISKVIEPYKEIANLLIRYLNDDAYKRKERVVEGLRKLV